MCIHKYGIRVKEDFCFSAHHKVDLKNSLHVAKRMSNVLNLIYVSTVCFCGPLDSVTGLSRYKLNTQLQMSQKTKYNIFLKCSETTGQSHQNVPHEYI